MESKLLSVENLQTYFYTRSGTVKAVDGVIFSVNSGESLALAGESGCGKSVSCLSILRMLPSRGARIVGGKIQFENEDLASKTESEMRRWRGKKIAMILQDPLMSLNPVYTIFNQVAESFLLDNKNEKRSLLRQKVIDILKTVNIPLPEERLNYYPFQFSGGMRQRTTAAISLARYPRLLIADEPTTSLDVTIQDQFLRLLKKLQQDHNMALILVTHDLGIVAENCDRVAIMYAGKIVESGSVKQVFERPVHPYTQALMKALPRMGARTGRLFQIEGEPPNPANLPSGCSFHPRCIQVMDICRMQYPPVTFLGPDTYSACWRLEKERV